MRANEMQVGGRHYKATTYEHWDWTLAVGAGYLEGQATKYVVRWRRKNGAEDLRKALHYLNKLDEERTRALEVVCRAHYDVVVAETARFAEANALPPIERAFFERIATWATVDDLAEARQLLFHLLDEVEGDPAPVPLTEENHHAQRVGQSDEEYHG